MGLRGIAILAVAAAFLSSPASAALVSLGKDACQGSCNKCEGDCDRDSDCSGSLRCFMRDGTQAVPGCSSDGEGNGCEYFARGGRPWTGMGMGTPRIDVRFLPFAICTVTSDDCYF